MSKVRFLTSILKKAVLLLVKLAKLATHLLIELSKHTFKNARKRFRVSITFKTSTTYTLIFSVILFFFSIGLTTAFGFYLFHQAKNTLEKKVQTVSILIKDETELPEASLKKYADIEQVTVSLFDINRKIIYTSGESADLPYKNWLNVSGIYVSPNQHIHYTVPVSLNDIRYVAVSKSLALELVHLLLLLAGLGVGNLLAIAFIIRKGSRALQRMLRPIDDMISTTRTISGKDLNKRLDVVDSHDELKELAETFNEMLDRIQMVYEQQNQFVSDASHELRTPISVIQGYANLLQRWGKEEKEVLDESVAAIKNEADNMKELVEKLLFLARADKDTQKIEKVRFSLNDLIDEVVKDTKLISNQHVVKGELQGIITVSADRRLLKQALRIFIDNSVKFTPPGGAVIIKAIRQKNRVIVTVEDTGIGIPAEELPYVFNRFYKCDKSRTREDGGTGLGLAIAKWIVERHRGNVRAESILGTGTRIIVNLPLE